MFATKTVPATLYLAIKKNLALPMLKAFADEAVPALIAAMKAQGLPSQGRLEFIYVGIDGNPDTLFDVWLPAPSLPKRQRRHLAFPIIPPPPSHALFRTIRGLWPVSARLGRLWPARPWPLA